MADKPTPPPPPPDDAKKKPAAIVKQEPVHAHVYSELTEGHFVILDLHSKSSSRRLTRDEALDAILRLGYAVRCLDANVKEAAITHS